MHERQQTGTRLYLALVEMDNFLQQEGGISKEEPR